MTPSRPYLIRAMYEWIVDNEMTPYLVVDANFEGAQVPEEFVEDGRIVLNVSPTACRGLHLENDRIVFSARFKGVAQQIFVPPRGVMAIYAKENGRGMVFGDEDETTDAEGGSGDITPAAPTSGESTASSSPKKPVLKVVK